ncbi:MAG: NCS2 family permease [Xanthobacteraceae bacterium]|nr:NCS2 family permease [Xanthobacteraceae bacterium]
MAKAKKAAKAKARAKASSRPQPSQLENWLNEYFSIGENGSTIRTEIIAGITTFLTMAYIIVVNPQILAKAGMPHGAVFVATCLAAAVATAMMGLYAKYPIALAPGMGLNAFFAFTIVLTYKYTWQQALWAVFLSGVLFFLVSVFRVREYIINAIPLNLKLAISAGVGLFLAIIALENAGIIVDHPATLVTLGKLDPRLLASWPAILAIFGFILIAALNYRNIPGATIIGMLVVAAVGIPLGLTKFGGVVSLPPSLSPTLLAFDWSRTFELSFIVAVLTLFLIDVFDNAGTLIGVTHRSGLLDKKGNLPRMRQALISDSFAAMFGSAIGTSTTTSYIESSAGVAAGGRTGLTAVVVSILFLLALFFSPLAASIPAYASAAALLFVAAIMARGLSEMDWNDITEYAPAIVCAVSMPLTYSIATGIGLGFITFALIKIFAGKEKDVTPALFVLAILFAIKFAFT